MYGGPGSDAGDLTQGVCVTDPNANFALYDLGKGAGPENHFIAGQCWTDCDNIEDCCFRHISALGRCYARPASSRPFTEAEHSDMLSAPVRLDARSLTTRFALRIGPVDWNRGEELMFTSTSNADTASAAVEARCP